MDVMLEEYYTSTRKDVSFSGFPTEMVPILEMIAAISACNKDVSAGLTKEMTPQQYSLFVKEKLKNINAVLCANSENVNAVNHQSDSCLHFAVRRSDCDSDVVRELLNHGADPNKANKKGDTPLHSTARMCASSEIMRILLKHGGNVKIQNCNGDTPLHIASRKSHSSAEVLLDHGANAETTNFNFRNVMHAALEGKNCDLSFIVKCLDRYPHLVNSREARNITPLHLAVLDCECKTSVIKELLRRGADVNARDVVGRTPLHWIKYNSDPPFNVIRALLRKGANINAKDVINRTPLFYAVRSHSFLVVEQLIAQGADVNTFDLMYKTVLNEAVNGYELGEKVKSVQEQHPVLLKQEIIKTFHNTQLFSPLMTNVFRHSTLVQLLNMKATNGRIEIDNQKQIEVIKLLLENGADPDFGNLEYRLSPFSVNVPCPDKLLIQYRVLNNFEKVLSEKIEKSGSIETAVRVMTTFDIEIFNQEFHEEWLNFREECIFEINKMRRQKLYNDMSLYEFVVQRCSKAKDFELAKFDLVDTFLQILTNNEYPNCKDILYASIKRDDLLNRVRHVQIFACREDKTHNQQFIVLDMHTMCHIIRYLSKEDLINFVLSCTSESKSTPDSLSSNGQILKREAGVQSNENINTKQNKNLSRKDLINLVFSCNSGSNSSHSSLSSNRQIVKRKAEVQINEDIVIDTKQKKDL